MRMETELATSTSHIWDAVREANEGNAEALAHVRRMLTGPEADEMIAWVGNLNTQAMEAILWASLQEGEHGSREIILARISDLRTELGWNAATDLQRLVIERVVHGWLAVHFAEIRLNQYSEVNEARAKYLDDRLSKAEKRYLASLRTLATLRKLGSPTNVRVDVSVQ